MKNNLKNKKICVLWVFFFLISFVSYGQDAPPQATIVSPLNGSVFNESQIRVVFVVSGSEPRSARILVNDRAVQLLTEVTIGENTVIVDVPERDSKISVIVQNEFGASAPATVNLIRDERIFKPSLYVLAIGVSNYDNPALRLQFPAKDASDFTQTIMRQAGLMYESVEVRLLTDRTATAENIRDGLQWLQTETAHRDIAMLYIAGHGINDNTGDFFFMPVAADLNRIYATCISYADIKRTVDAVAGKLLVFMDACHSGNVLGSVQQRSAVIARAVTELSDADNGAIVFTSSTGNQFSLESPEWNNGVFTKALVEGLNGAADMLGRDVVTVKSLEYYVANRVKELTQGQQAPTTIIPGSVPDFPIAVVTVKVDVTIRVEEPTRSTTNRVQSSQRILTGSEDYALLHFYRPWDIVGSTLGVEVFLNGGRISVVGNNSKVSVQINNPANSTLSATFQNVSDRVRRRQQTDSRIALNIEPGREYFIRVSHTVNSLTAGIVNNMTGAASSSAAGATPKLEIRDNENIGRAEFDNIVDNQ